MNTREKSAVEYADMLRKPNHIMYAPEDLARDRRNAHLAGQEFAERRILEMLRIGSYKQDMFGWQWAEWIERELGKEQE